MPWTDELTVTYGGLTFGGSTARRLQADPKYTVVDKGYEVGVFEFSFITSAATAAAFATEVAAVEGALRTPRGDLVVTLSGSTLLSLKQSDNTGLDANPQIVKTGSRADTGRSRYYDCRIEFQLPADNVSTDFRRYSTVDITYSPSRRRTVSITAVYTANSDDGSTQARAQYEAQITTYAATVTQDIDSNATWEKVEEPSVSRNDTDTLVTATIVYRERLANQTIGSKDDSAIVDPSLTIERHRVAPGDSEGTSLRLLQSSVQLVGGGSGSTVAELPVQTPAPGQTGSVKRPVILTANYACGIDATVTKNIKAKWLSAIRPFIISEIKKCASTGVVILDERPAFDPEENRFTAVVTAASYSATILSQRVEVQDTNNPGRNLRPVWDGNPYSYYDYPGIALRTRTIREKREEKTDLTDAQTFVRNLVQLGHSVTGIENPADWVVLSRRPLAAILKKGMEGGVTVNIAEVEIETVLQYRKKKNPSIANAGGVTGAGLSL